LARGISHQCFELGRLSAEASGIGHSKGVVSSTYQGSDRSDVEGRTRHQGMVGFHGLVFLGRRQERGHGYAVAETLVQILKQCGNERTRDNVMKQAANLKDVEIGLLLLYKDQHRSYRLLPDEQMQISRFNGEHGELIGKQISGEPACDDRP
jgi:hypothetical protein